MCTYCVGVLLVQLPYSVSTTDLLIITTANSVRTLCVCVCADGRRRSSESYRSDVNAFPRARCKCLR